MKSTELEVLRLFNQNSSYHWPDLVIQIQKGNFLIRSVHLKTLLTFHFCCFSNKISEAESWWKRDQNQLHRHLIKILVPSFIRFRRDLLQGAFLLFIFLHFPLYSSFVNNSGSFDFFSVFCFRRFFSCGITSTLKPLNIYCFAFCRFRNGNCWMEFFYVHRRFLQLKSKIIEHLVNVNFTICEHARELLTRSKSCCCCCYQIDSTLKLISMHKPLISRVWAQILICFSLRLFNGRIQLFIKIPWNHNSKLFISVFNF